MARTNTGASANYFEYSGTPPVTAVPITMMCWFMVPDVTNYYALMAVLKFANAGTDDYFSLGAAGTTAGDPVFAEVAQGGGYFGASSGTGYTANTWNHACGVFTTNALREAYCNAGTVGSETTSRTPTAASIDRMQMTSFVSQAGTFSPLNGRIANAGVWNVALSLNEITAHARGVDARRIRPQSLVSFWDFVAAETGDEADLHARGLNATAYAMTENGTMGTANHAPVTLSSIFGLTRYSTLAEPSSVAGIISGDEEGMLYQSVMRW